ncbi:MAG: hypothetical protein ABW122_01130, partial [Ilumatobacteraceae bacterium]
MVNVACCCGPCPAETLVPAPEPLTRPVGHPVVRGPSRPGRARRDRYPGHVSATTSTGASFGTNSWLVEEMYEQYREDP